MSTPYKDPRSGVYKLRKGIPEELRPFFINEKTGKPQKEYWRTLDTKDLKEAKRLFPDALAEWERLQEAARAELEGTSYRLTDREAQGLAGEWLKAELKDAKDVPDAEAIEIHIDSLYDRLQRPHQRIDWDHWNARANEIINARKLPVLANTESYQKLREALASAEVKLWNLISRRERGDWRDKGLSKYPTYEDQAASTKLIDVFDRWEKATQGGWVKGDCPRVPGSS